MESPVILSRALFDRVSRKVAPHVEANAKMRACAARIREHGTRQIAECLAIGKELVAARELCRAAYADDPGTGDGEWRNFLDEEVQIEWHQARRFICVYEKWGGHVAPPPNLSFRVLAELAAPEADPVVVAAIEEKVAKGERVTVAQVAAAKREVAKRSAPSKKNPPAKDTDYVRDFKLRWKKMSAAEKRSVHIFVGRQMTKGK